MNTNEQNILNNLPGLNPPDAVWEKIEKELDKDERRRILPYWLRYAGIAAACLSVSFFTWRVFEDGFKPVSNAYEPKVVMKDHIPNQGSFQKKDHDTSQRRFQYKKGSYLQLGDTSIRIGNVWLNQTGLDGSDQYPVLTKEWGFNGPVNTMLRRNYIVSDNIGYKSLEGDIVASGLASDPDVSVTGLYTMEYENDEINSSPGALVDHNGIEIKSNWVPLIGNNLMPGTIQAGGISNGIYYDADTTAPFKLKSPIVVTGTVDTRMIETYTLTYYIEDSDGDHVPNLFDSESVPGIIHSSYSKPFTVDDIRDSITGYINVGLIAGKNEDDLRYQCVIKDTVSFDMSKFNHEKREPVSNTESYAGLVENEFKNPFLDPLSTFSIDVDNASYTNTRRMLMAGEMPPKDAVRIEEFVNYFSYEYPQPIDQKPFSINMETASCPWNKDTRLVRIGVQGMDVNREQLPSSNLVFLVDVSGSMDYENKLPLVKRSLKLLVDQMRPQDQVALVTYAGAAGLALKSTACSENQTIKDAIDHLEAGGSTAGGEGLELAYKTALENFMVSGNNRIILVTDGDFNVGLQTDEEMKTLIESRRKDGVYLTVCGFGMGNLKDSKMETLADFGNGNYYYIDNFRESRKVFASGLTGTLLTIAKDVKIQVEFNPALVKAYRLIGYENRLMEARDFADDTKDAGELGAGHTVTALYEIIPAGSTAFIPGFTELKYQQADGKLKEFGNELLTLRMRYKNPGEDSSRLLEQALYANSNGFEQASDNFRFACGVTVFGMMLRDSKFKGLSSYEMARLLIEGTKLNEKDGYKQELLTLIDKVKLLSVPQ